MYFSLTNSKKRTAQLFLLSLNKPKAFRTVVPVGEEKNEPENQNILARKPGWAQGMTPSQIAEALIKGDPEISPNKPGEPITVGRPIKVHSSVYLDATGKPVHQFKKLEDKFTPDGKLKETKPYKPTVPNIEIPLQIAPKGSQKIEELPAKFVVHKIYQVIHTDSLSFDFLYALCKDELQNRGFVRLTAGLKGNEPIVLRSEGLPVFGYLQGRVEGEKYCCTLHLTHQELKTPAATPPTAQAGA